MFTGGGWRRENQPGCHAPHPDGRWRCERAAKHKSWHCCDNGSWPSEKDLADKVTFLLQGKGQHEVAIDHVARMLAQTFNVSRRRGESDLDFIQRINQEAGKLPDW